MNRRDILRTSAALAASRSFGQTSSAARLPVQKGIIVSMFPKGLSIPDRFKMARDVGFNVMECHTTPDERAAEEIKKASEAAGVPVTSVMNEDHWQYPLSSPDPEVVAKSVKGMETSLRNAKMWGADTVLLVPGVVNPQVAYRDAWNRSVKAIRGMIPLAQQLKVAIAVENVWNKFLLSPMEFAQYVDQFKSPWVKAYFDVGNVLLYGYPQDWIRTLGHRIAKVHLKDFRYRQDPQIKKRVTEFVNLREGDIDWKEVRQALADIGYKGAMTVELNGGDEMYLRDLSHRVDLILEGA